jgi:flagellar capping protein FliD
MLYLIKEYGKENKEYLKIGKADNVNKRMQQYNTDCAEFELIDTFEGSVPEENLLHSFLNKYIIKGEWMEYNEEILLLWKLYKEIRPKVKESILQHENYIDKSWYDTQLEYYEPKIKEYEKLLKEREELLYKQQDLIEKLCDKYEEQISILKETIKTYQNRN